MERGGGLPEESGADLVESTDISGSCCIAVLGLRVETCVSNRCDSKWYWGFLLTRGRAPQAGCTPLGLAEHAGKEAVAQVLRAAGGK